MGRPLPGVPVVLVDPVTGALVDGRARARSASTCRRGPLTLMTGYHGDAERNAEAMAGGYYHTGDVARGTPTATSPTSAAPTTSSRPRDYKISPFELESRADRAPGGRRGGGRAGARRRAPRRAQGLRRRWPRATSRTPRPRTSILAYAREHLAPYQRVRRLEFSELPKTISGKIRRVELRQRETRVRGQPPAEEFRDDDFPDLKT